MTAAIDVPVFGIETEVLLLTEFRRAAADVPAYRALLDAQGAAPTGHDLSSFSRCARCCPKPIPSTGSSSTNERRRHAARRRRRAHELGHGGRFSFGVISRKQVGRERRFHRLGVRRRVQRQITEDPHDQLSADGRGVLVHCMTVATTSVREDMAVALVETFGHHYEQIVLCGDPLFLKRFTDYARERHVDWSRYRVNAMIGEEIFGEHFRGYLADSIGLNVDRPARVHHVVVRRGRARPPSGLRDARDHRLRRASLGQSRFARDLLGAHSDDGTTLPMIFTFNPLRTFIEVVDPDIDGIRPDDDVDAGSRLGGTLAPLSDRRHRAPARPHAGDGPGAPSRGHACRRSPADAPGIAGPGEGSAAERIARGLLQGRAVRRSPDRAS